MAGSPATSRDGRRPTLARCGRGTVREGRGRARCGRAAGVPRRAEHRPRRRGGCMVRDVPVGVAGLPRPSAGQRRAGVAGHDRPPQGHRPDPPAVAHPTPEAAVGDRPSPTGRGPATTSSWRRWGHSPPSSAAPWRTGTSRTSPMSTWPRSSSAARPRPVAAPRMASPAPRLVPEGHRGMNDEPTTRAIIADLAAAQATAPTAWTDSDVDSRGR